MWALPLPHPRPSCLWFTLWRMPCAPSLPRTLQRAPLRRLVDIDEIGALCTFLAGDGAKAITGSTLYVDAGYHILG